MKTRYLIMAATILSVLSIPIIANASSSDVISSFNSSIYELLNIQNTTRLSPYWGSFYQELSNGSSTTSNVAYQGSIYMLSYCFANNSCGNSFYQNRSILRGALLGLDQIGLQINYSDNNSLREGSLQKSYAQQAFILREMIDAYRTLDNNNSLINVTRTQDLGYTGSECQTYQGNGSNTRIHLINCATSWNQNYTETDGTNVSQVIGGSNAQFDLCFSQRDKWLVDADGDNYADEFVNISLRLRINSTNSLANFRKNNLTGSTITMKTAFTSNTSTWNNYTFQLNGSLLGSIGNETSIANVNISGETYCMRFAIQNVPNTTNMSIDYIEYTIDRKTPLLNKIKDVANFFILNQNSTTYGYTRGRLFANQALTASAALYNLYNLTGDIQYKNIADQTFSDTYSRNTYGILGEQNSILDSYSLHVLGYDTYQMVSLGALTDVYEYANNGISLSYNQSTNQDLGFSGTETQSPSDRNGQIIYLGDTSTDWIVNSTSPDGTNVSIAITGTSPHFDVCIESSSKLQLDSDYNNFLDPNTTFNLSFRFNDSDANIDFRHIKYDGTFSDVTGGTNFGIGSDSWRTVNFSLNSSAPNTSADSIYLSSYSIGGGQNICTRFLIFSSKNISIDYVNVSIVKLNTTSITGNDILDWVNQTWDVESHWTLPDLKMQSGASTRTQRVSSKCNNNWYYSALYFSRFISLPNRFSECVIQNFTAASITPLSIRTIDNSGNFIRLYNLWNSSISASKYDIENNNHFIWNSNNKLTVVKTNQTTYYFSHQAATPSGGIISDIYHMTTDHLFSGIGGESGYNGIPYGAGVLIADNNCSNAWDLNSSLNIISSSYPFVLEYTGTLTYPNQTTCNINYTTTYNIYDQYIEVYHNTTNITDLNIWSISKETIGDSILIAGVPRVLNNATILPININLSYNDTLNVSTWGIVDKYNSSGNSFNYIIGTNQINNNNYITDNQNRILALPVTINTLSSNKYSLVSYLSDNIYNISVSLNTLGVVPSSPFVVYPNGSTFYITDYVYDSSSGTFAYNDSVPPGSSYLYLNSVDPTVYDICSSGQSSLFELSNWLSIFGLLVGALFVLGVLSSFSFVDLNIPTEFFTIDNLAGIGLMLVGAAITISVGAQIIASALC